MGTTRLETFSDAFIAIIMTIMVLELKVPEGGNLAALKPILPIFLAYVMSYTYVSIYWNNHHHLMHATEHVDGKVLWSNLHLLFWLSLIPFVTSWMEENHYAPLPTALYGVVLLFAAMAYSILQYTIIAHHGERSLISRAVGSDLKGKLSIVAYVAAIPLAFLSQWISIAIYVGVACAWLIPDRRIETKMEEADAHEEKAK